MPSLQSYLFRPMLGFMAARQKNLSTQQLRASSARWSKGFILPGGVMVEKIEEPTFKGVWVRAKGVITPKTILYLHGGGYILGSVATHQPLVASIVKASGRQAFLLEYRLAPEHPFPAALNDALTAYRWLLQQGLKAEDIVIAGDSAGGGLTIATLLALREAGEPLPAAGIGLSAWLDLAKKGESYTTNAKKDPLLQGNALANAALDYAGEHDLHTPLISPIYADLQGLPPLLMQVGGDELLLSENTDFAECARRAGVKISFEVWDNMWHGWQIMLNLMPESKQAIDHIGKFIQANQAN